MGDVESALASRFREGFLQEGTSELSHLTFHSQPSSGEEGPWLSGKISPVSQLPDGKLGLGPGRPRLFPGHLTMGDS